jgi:hypothetical protein
MFFENKLIHFKMRQKTEMWRTYRATIKTKWRNSESRKVLPPGGLKWGMENAVLFSIVAPVCKTRNSLKEAFGL